MTRSTTTWETFPPNVFTVTAPFWIILMAKGFAKRDLDLLSKKTLEAFSSTLFFEIVFWQPKHFIKAEYVPFTSQHLPRANRKSMVLRNLNFRSMYYLRLSSRVHVLSEVATKNLSQTFRYPDTLPALCSTL